MRLFILLLTVTFGLTANAQTTANSRLTSLRAALDEFNQATIALEIGTVMTFFPPKVLEVVAEDGGITIPQLLELAQENGAKVREAVTIHSSNISTDDLQFTFQARTGSPMQTFAFLPYRIDLEFDGNRIIRTGNYLALNISSQWYFLDLFDAGNVASLRKGYPLFIGMDLPTQGQVVPAT